MEITFDNITDNSVESLGLFTGVLGMDNAGNEEDSQIEDNNKSVEEDDFGGLKGLPDDFLEEVDGEEKDSIVVDKKDVNAAKETQDKGDASESDSSGLSPKSHDSEIQNLYSSIAQDLYDGGVLNLDESYIKEVDSSEKLHDLFKMQIDTMLTEHQKRISDALDNNVPVDTIKYYESWINNLSNISEKDIMKEDNEKLRSDLIYREFKSRGFSDERAKREVKKSVDSGNDVDDAKDALKALIDFFNSQYQDILDEAKENTDNAVKAEKERTTLIKKKFMETEEPVKGMKLSKLEREKLYNQATQIVGKTKEGVSYTALQKYAFENQVDWQYYMNLLFHQTNGFKDLSKVVSKEVLTQKKNTMKNLENVIRNQKNNDSGLDFGNSTEMSSLSGLGLRVNLD